MKHLDCGCLRFGRATINPNLQRMQALYLLQTIKLIFMAPFTNTTAQARLRCLLYGSCIFGYNVHAA